MHDLGQELPFGHRDRLRLGVAGMHQALEHHRTVVDVVVDRQVHPAQAAVRDAALDLVLSGDDVARAQLRHKCIRTAAVWAPAFRRPITLRAGPSHRPAAVPAEPLGLRDHRIGHQSLERIDVRHPRDLHQAAAEVSDRLQHPRRSRHPILWLGVPGADVHWEVVVIVEIGAEERLGALRPQCRPGGGLSGRLVVQLAGRAPGVLAGALWCGFFRGFGHQSTYLGAGGTGAGPRTVNHLRYNVFHVPSRRMRSSVPLTNRTSPVLSRLIPTP